MFEKIQRVVSGIFKQEYAKASIYYVFANIMGQGIVLLSSAIFTRMMSKSDYGLVSTYSTWVLILNTFVCLNLFITVRNAYIDYADDYDNYNSSVLLLGIISGILMSILIVGIVLILGIDITFGTAFFACVQAIALNIVNYMMAIQAMKNEYKQRAFLMFAPNWLHVFLSIALMSVFVHNIFIAKIAGNAVGILLFGVLCTINLFKKARPKIIIKYWKYAVIISLPSIFHTLSDLILIQCDRLMLTSMVGAEVTAEYSVVYNVGSVIVAIYQAVNGAWTSWFYKSVAVHDEENTKRYQRYYMLFFSLFSAGMMTISPELIKIISPKDYWNGISYVGLIVVASYFIFLYAFFSTFLMYKKQTGKIARNTIIAATINLVINYLCIPRYEAMGAVIATVVSYIVLFFLHYYTIGQEGRRYFAIKNMWLNIGFIVGYNFLFSYIIDSVLIRYALFTVICVAVYFIKGKRIMHELMR